MYKCLGRILRITEGRKIVNIYRPCCNGNNIQIENKNTHTKQVFHPRLHDGYIFGPMSSIQYRYLTTSSQSQVEDEPDELFRLISVEVKGHDLQVLKSYAKYVFTAARLLDIDIRIFNPPRIMDRRTLNKSVFSSRLAKVQYEIRTYYRVVELKHLTGSTASVFLEYIQRNLPEGCAMKVTKHKLGQLPENVEQSIKNNLKKIDAQNTIAEAAEDTDVTKMSTNIKVEFTDDMKDGILSDTKKQNKIGQMEKDNVTSTDNKVI